MKKIIIISIFLISGCETTNLTSTVYLPENVISDAQEEIKNYSYNQQFISKKEYLELLNLSTNAIWESAIWFCNEYSPSPEKCSNFKFEYIEDDSFNAFATEEDGEYKVVVHTGIFKHVTTIEEVSFIIAHELAHHINNHIDFTTRNINIGEFTGKMLGMIFLGSLAKGKSRDTIESALEIGSDLGGAIGNVGGQYYYSSEQELEADYTALFILQNAWLNLNIARNAILKTTQTSEMSEKFLQSHPSGPRRLASFDLNLRKAKDLHYQVLSDGCKNIYSDVGAMDSYSNCSELFIYDDAAKTNYFSRMRKSINDPGFEPTYKIIK